MAEELSRGVKTLLGDPKSAVLKLSGLMIIGAIITNLSLNLNNFFTVNPTETVSIQIFKIK